MHSYYLNHCFMYNLFVIRFFLSSPGTAIPVTGYNSFRLGSLISTLVVDSVSCSGDETNLFECQTGQLGQHSCHLYDTAGVFCPCKSLSCTPHIASIVSNHLLYPLVICLQLTPAAVRTELHAWSTRVGPMMDVWSCVWAENGCRSVWISLSPFLVGPIKMQKLSVVSWDTQMLKVHACINEAVKHLVY